LLITLQFVALLFAFAFTRLCLRYGCSQLRCLRFPVLPLRFNHYPILRPVVSGWRLRLRFGSPFFCLRVVAFGSQFRFDSLRVLHLKFAFTRCALPRRFPRFLRVLRSPYAAFRWTLRALLRLPTLHISVFVVLRVSYVLFLTGLDQFHCR